MRIREFEVYQLLVSKSIYYTGDRTSVAKVDKNRVRVSLKD